MASIPPIYTLTVNPALDISTSVDQIVPALKLRCAAGRQDPGGGGINVARVASRLGHNVTAVYPIGGTTGNRLRQLVDAEGIRSVTIELKGETRQSFTVLEKETGYEYRFVLPGPSLDETEVRHILETLQSSSDQPDFIVMSGSLPSGVPEDVYARAARISKTRGARIVLDTSGLPLHAALSAGVYLVKPNLRELRELTSAPLLDLSTQVSACRELIEKKQTEIVALTLGEEGALLITRDQAVRALPVSIQPASSVGAGDSFLGGMVWALANGLSLEDSFRYAMAAGSATLLTPGTELCRKEDVEKLCQEVRLVPL